MARNPYELRMECLQMAENRLQSRYFENRQRYEYLTDMGIEQDPYTYPVYPTDDEIEVILEDDNDSEESAIESLMEIDIHEEITESSEESDDSEYDELDNAYSELVDENALDNTEDGNLDYFHTLDKKTKKTPKIRPGSESL